VAESIARTDGKGQTAYFEYDDAGRQVAALYALVEPVYFAYDLAGNRTLMQDEWGATYWTYNVLGRPTSRQDPRGTTVYYAYGDRGERTELTVQGQGTVYYEYGPTGLMDYVLDGKTGLRTYYEYDPASRVRYQHHPNAAATYFVYDSAGRLTEKVTKKDSDGSVLVRFAYTRDAVGNPIAIERESGLGVFYYEYDELQRLAYEGQFVAAVRQYENYYEYDPVGNRTLLRHGETDAENLTYYEYDEANELVNLHDKDGWTYFAYDNNGNTVAEQTPSWTRYYDWDGRDMLADVRSTEQGWTDNVYRYDGLASRVSTLESGGFTYYDWDGINVLQEKAGAGAVTGRQVHGYAPIFSVGDIALMDKSGTAYVPVSDQVGTVWNLVDSSAAKANSYTYDAFGVGRSVSEDVFNVYRFGTKRLGEDVGLWHFVARDYHAGSGRFFRRDPARGTDEGGWYHYAQNAPGSFSEPAGLWPVWVHDEMVGPAAEGVLRSLANPPVSAACLAAVLDGLKVAQARQDLNPGYAVEHRRHYTRLSVGYPVPPDRAREDRLNRHRYDREYRLYVFKTVYDFEHKLRGHHPKCPESLTDLGMVSHSWQDFYAHAIRRDGLGGRESSPAPGWVAWTALPPIPPRTGDPRNRANFWPSSYPGEHPGPSVVRPLGTEPLTYGSAEYNARFREAEAFTRQRYSRHLPLWWKKCACWCNQLGSQG